MMFMSSAFRAPACASSELERLCLVLTGLFCSSLCLRRMFVSMSVLLFQMLYMYSIASQPHSHLECHRIL